MGKRNESHDAACPKSLIPVDTVLVDPETGDTFLLGPDQVVCRCAE